MAGLTTIGLGERIKAEDYTLTRAEAVDLFFLFPTLVDIKRDDKGTIKTVSVTGLNLEFKMRK